MLLSLERLMLSPNAPRIYLVFWIAFTVPLFAGCDDADNTPSESVQERPYGSDQYTSDSPNDPIEYAQTQAYQYELDESEFDVGESLPSPKQGSGKSLAQMALEEKRRQDALAARGITEIGWEDLMPEGEEERLAELFQAQMTMLYSQNIIEGSAADQMIQIGTFNTVPELNGKQIRMPGYTVPFVFAQDALVEEFLLVPYFGACLHAPPPPPNQTVLVRMKTPIKRSDLDQAVWVQGEMQTETASTDLADAAYTIVADNVVKFDY